jgi:hypothetical protein
MGVVETGISFKLTSLTPRLKELLKLNNPKAKTPIANVRMPTKSLFI